MKIFSGKRISLQRRAMYRTLEGALLVVSPSASVLVGFGVDFDAVFCSTKMCLADVDPWQMACCRWMYGASGIHYVLGIGA